MRTFVFICLALLLPAVGAQTIHAVSETSATTITAKDGKVGGPMAELVGATLRQAGFNDYRIDIYPWARAMQLTQLEPNTLIFPIARTSAREPQFKWVGELRKVDYYFFKRSDRKDIVIRRLEDARPYKIGVVRDDVRHQFLQSKSFPRLVPMARWDDNVAHVLNGQLDMVVLTDINLGPTCATQHLDCSTIERSARIDELSTGLYLAYGPGTPDAVVQRTRAAFEQLKAQGVIERHMARVR